MVSLEVAAVMPDGKRLEVKAGIAAPRQEPDGSWICEVAVAPLQAQTLNVRGVDSFHAVWLSCSLILKLLSALKGGGSQLVNPDGSEFPLDAYLAGLDEKR